MSSKHGPCNAPARRRGGAHLSVPCNASATGHNISSCLPPSIKTREMYTQAALRALQGEPNISGNRRHGTAMVNQFSDAIMFNISLVMKLNGEARNELVTQLKGPRPQHAKVTLLRLRCLPSAVYKPTLLTRMHVFAPPSSSPSGAPPSPPHHPNLTPPFHAPPPTPRAWHLLSQDRLGTALRGTSSAAANSMSVRHAARKATHAAICTNCILCASPHRNSDMYTIVRNEHLPPPFPTFL